MIPSHRGRLIALVLLLLCLIWFSTRKGDETSKQRHDLPQEEEAATPQKIVIRKIEILPYIPNPQSTLEVKIETVPPGIASTNYQYKWRINNQEVSQAASLPPGRLRNGDTVSVEVTPLNQHADESLSSPSRASVKIGNNVPVIKTIQLTPIPVSFGETVRAEVIAEDIDGDFVLLQYEWKVNGKPIDANDQAFLPGDQVHSADTIFVVVTPADPYSKGAPRFSPLLTVLNRPPEIVSLPPNQDEKGKYTYQVVAKDPDLDPLHYTLLKGPPEMKLDPVTGLILWDVASLSENQSDVGVEVTDGKGGKVVQQFTLQIAQTRR